jgi:osmotically-inducible protein OsmY
MLRQSNDTSSQSFIRDMIDRWLRHDATDWIRTLEEQKTADHAAREYSIEASRGEAGTDKSAGPAADLDLASQIDWALHATGYPPLRDVHILAVEGTAVLRGVVPTYYMKQIAQAAVSAIPGVSELHNELDVVPLDK